MLLAKKSVMLNRLLIATKWMPVQGHLQPVIDTAAMVEVLHVTFQSRKHTRKSKVDAIASFYKLYIRY